MTFFIILL